MEPKYYSRSEFLRYSGIGLLSIPTIISAFGCGNKGTAISKRNAIDCMLTPESIEGPFYIEHSLVRSDIRDNKLGIPLEIKLTVVESETCKPIPQALVDIWHCDAVGYYSGVQNGNPDGGGMPPDTNLNGMRPREDMPPPGPQRTNEMPATPSPSNEKFLRGVQVTNEEGVVHFTSIYPGWYAGRAVHIHCKIFLKQALVATTQLYLPQALNNEIHADHEPYQKRFPIAVPNDDDMLYREGGQYTTLRAKKAEGKVIAELTMGIKQV